MRRNFVSAVLVGTAMVLTMAVCTAAMPSKMNDVKRAAASTERDTKKAGKSVAKSSRKSSKTVAKSSAAAAKDSAEVGVAGGVALARGAKATSEAPAKLVHKVGHKSSAHAKSRAR
jgi:hypothetical protein